MGQKKSSKIILIMIILVLLLILLAGVAYVYFATDLFRGNKELFFKYFSQIGDENEGFIEGSLKDYYNKKQNTSYLNDGNFSVNITSDYEQEQFENTNKMNLTFQGQVDNTNSQIEQNISLNYSEDVNFPIVFRKVGDIVGIQTEYVGSRFIATDLSSEVMQNQETEDLGKIEEISNVELSQEEIQHIKDTYFNVLNQNLQDNSFSKIEEVNSKGYKLILNGEQIKNISIKLLETLKNDQITLEKMNEYLKVYKNSLKITTNNIDEIIENLNDEEDIVNENIEIVVYQSKGKTKSINIKLDEAEIKIEKTLTSNDLQYNINLKRDTNNQTVNIGFIMNFSGLQTKESISEKYELILENEKIRCQYNYNNNLKFTDKINIELFTNNNSMRIDKMEEEERNTLINAIVQRITNVTKNQMEKLGVDENPLIYVIPQLALYSNAIDAINDTRIDEIEIVTFNAKFENYESSNLKGVTVKGLLSTIALNNETNAEKENRKIKEIHFDGEEYEVTDQNITLLKSSVETETEYRVEFERDEDTGIIYRAVINKK